MAARRDRKGRAVRLGLSTVVAVAAFGVFSLISGQAAGADESGAAAADPSAEATAVDPMFAPFVEPGPAVRPPVDPMFAPFVEPPPPVTAPEPAPTVAPAPIPLAPPSPPTAAGRRVVYSNSKQRVWLFEGDGTLFSTYLVSGRRGMPRPGTYSVFSRSPVAYSGSVHMRWMVRFARGSRLAIGFHAIPVGRRGPIQSLRELGQFRSHGCVRQAPVDAERLWNFAPLGTRVVVTA